MKKNISVAVIIILTCIQSVYAQITTNELPISIQRGLIAQTNNKNSGLINLPVPDIKKVFREDSLYQEKNPKSPLRTSIPIPVKLDINKDGVWNTLDDGGKLWQMEIHAYNAIALDFVFSNFWLPKAGKFFIFNPSTKETIGAITSQYLSGEKKHPDKFSTGIVKGDKVILEYYQPASEKETPNVIVEKAYYTYIPVPGFNTSCDSAVNVNCSEGSNWQFEKNAVALVYRKFTNGGGWCSGALVNNTLSNRTPYFLTANHCLSYYSETKDYYGDDDLSGWIFYWGYELPSCSESTQPSYNKSTTGADIIANNIDSDFALLQLRQHPKNLTGYYPYYLGWDATGNAGTGGVGIHHPKHDVKKISTYECTPQTTSYQSVPTSLWEVQWISTDHGHGITEPGSSGSPLINNDHRVIGQLYGGDSTCDDLTEPDYYGQLDVSWTGNGSFDSHRRLRDWLAPNNSNTLVLDGLTDAPISLSGPSYICSSSTEIYTISNLPFHYTVTWYFFDGFGPTAPTIQSSGDTCTVTNNLSQTYMGTLNAAIYNNGVLLMTLTKENIICYSGFYGIAIYGGTSNQFYPNSPVWVSKGNSVHLKSPNLIYKNVSYSVTTPSWWQYYAMSGDLYVAYPNVTTNGPILIDVQNNPSYPNCDNSYQLVIMPNNVLPHYTLNISVNNNEQIVVSLDETEKSDDVEIDLKNYSVKNTEFNKWTLDVYDATNSKKVISKTINEKAFIVNSTGWKSGVYIVKAVIGDQELSEKFVIK